jgi:cob(I)alamin adenosyltransferase
LKRGTCCGNICRHCPYGLENVKNATRRPAKLRSGDKETAQRMVKAIFEGGEINGNSPLLPPLPRPKNGTKASISTTTKNVPYTRNGDGGSSQLGTGERRSKDDCNFEALGTVDELCTVVGVCHAHLDADTEIYNYGNLPELLLDVLSRLFDIGSHVAKPKPDSEFSPNGIGDGFDIQHIDDLESWINEMTEALPELTSFILPTGAKAAAHLHVARTVCRRAERRVVPLVMDHGTCDPNALKYLNRLSDFLFVAARYVNFCEGRPEIQYQRDTSDTTQRQRITRSLQPDGEN